MNAEHAPLVALLRTRPEKLTWRKLTDQVRKSDSARRVWNVYNPDALIASPEASAALTEAETDLQEWDREGLTFVSVLDPEFPQRLLHVPDVPPFLFARGSVRIDDPGVAVVGSRNASPRGIQMATEIAEYLVGEGLSVVSGLAAGIDAAAHRAALRGGGRTVAFIATGINRSYPATNRKLQADIVDQGLVLSQFWPDAPPQKQNFLKRNGLISGYSLAAIVVEAGETSGARNLARTAVEQGRPVILTDLVAQANEWAKTLAFRPGVHVVSGVNDIAAIVGQIRSQHNIGAQTGRCERE